MAEQINVYDIEQFERIAKIPLIDIDDEIVSQVRNAHEKEELEPAILEILHDPNETPHGPTEIADIITSKITIDGQRCEAAFVLKGKSFPKVKSRDVTHQFAKLRQVPGLDVAIFGAVGHIQDDARRDFFSLTSDLDCASLLLDAEELARLLLAYEKICPEDGTFYSDSGVCDEGHPREEGVTLEIEVPGDLHTERTKLQDVSTKVAKRYSAFLQVSPHYTKDQVRTIIEESTEDVKKEGYYRTHELRRYWGNQEAHVVWLYIAKSQEDVSMCNWFCRSMWISDDLKEQWKPTPLSHDEKIGEIMISWNDQYESLKRLTQENKVGKQEYLDYVNPILQEMEEHGQFAISAYVEYKEGGLSREEVIDRLRNRLKRVDQLYWDAGDAPIPPSELEDHSAIFEVFTDTVHRLYQWAEEEFIEDYTEQQWAFMIDNPISDYREQLQELKVEKRKVNR